MCENKTCGGCLHFHRTALPKRRVNGVTYKNGRCGLGFHDDTDPGCRIWKDRDVPEQKEAKAEDPLKGVDELTGYRNRFTSNPWAQWIKKK